jgi:hypothetical protein
MPGWQFAQLLASRLLSKRCGNENIPGRFSPVDFRAGATAHQGVVVET